MKEGNSKADDCTFFFRVDSDGLIMSLLAVWDIIDD